MPLFNADQQRQVQEQLARIKSVNPTVDATQAMRQAIVDVAGANKYDPQAQLQLEAGAGGLLSAGGSFLSGLNPKDPLSVLGAQQAANIGQAAAEAELNRIREVSPYGTSEYIKDPTTGQITRQMSLSPEQQQILQQYQALEGERNNLASSLFGQVKSNFAAPFDYSGLPQAPGEAGLGAERKRIEDEIYGKQRARLDEQYAQEQEQLEQTLANRGIPRFSEAYNRAIDDFENRKRADYENARISSIQSGGEELSRSFGLQGSARDRAIQEALSKRQMPLNEMGLLLGQQRGITNPEFSAMPNINVNPLDVANTSFGYTQLGSQEQQAAADRAAQLQISKINAAAQPDLFALQKLKGEQEAALNQQRFQQELQLLNQNKPSSSGFWGGVVGNVLSPIFTGFGYAAGNSLIGNKSTSGGNTGSSFKLWGF